MKTSDSVAQSDSQSAVEESSQLLLFGGNSSPAVTRLTNRSVHTDTNYGLQDGNSFTVPDAAPPTCFRTSITRSAQFLWLQHD